jgi:ferredoxin
MNYYESLNIYYFSGTGNALSAAKWIWQKGQESVINSTMHSIEEERQINTEPAEGRSLNVFAYPTHGFIGPWIMLKFLVRFPRIKNGDAVFLNTRGGFKLGRFYIPGVSGLALWFPCILFLLRGFRVRGMLPLDMPHSWISFFPPNSKTASEAIAKRCRGIVEKLCDRVFSGRRYIRYTVLTHFWIDVLVAPIVPLYLLMGRFVLAKTLFASSECNNCSICRDACPVNAIVIRNERPYWMYNCESCMRCMNICPRRAVQSWVTRILLIGYILFILVTTRLNFSENLAFILVSAAIFPFYWIYIRIVRFRFLNLFFTNTSLTKYWKRYLAPDVKPSDLKPGSKSETKVPGAGKS